jgi:hypothetical protein
MSTHSSWSRIPEADTVQHGKLAKGQKNSTEFTEEEEAEQDDFNFLANASLVYLLQQKEMKDGPDVSPASSGKDGKYDEPAPFGKSPPPMHSFEKHPFSKPQKQDTKGRKMSTLHLLSAKERHQGSPEYVTDDGLTPEEVKEYRKVNRVVRQLKKQLDPLNYTDFWFEAEQVHEALAFSNSVRRCIAQTGTFSHETERLDRWLSVMRARTASTSSSSSTHT